MMTGRTAYRLALMLTPLPLIVICAGCSFSRAWNKAAQSPPPADNITGRWEGRWLSEVNGHNDKLRAIITDNGDGTYETWFHAKYRRILGFKYKVNLNVADTNDLFAFTGEEDLGWLAGGVYRYDGFASPSTFVANYDSKYDRGIFEMTRPGTRPELPLAASKQLLIVTTGDWQTHTGSLQRFSRGDTNSIWEVAGPSIPVVLGRNGLGWGRGVHGFAPAKGPVKREGDGRSPAGVFRLSSAFGFAGQNEQEPITLPYRQIVPGLECVDDPGSAHYNEIVERTRIAQPDWQSSERMIEFDPAYRLGITVDHNVEPRLPGFGSCIFLHIWQGAGTGTSGCTAMFSSEIERLLYWLDPEHNPLLVQLPEKAYQKLKKQWRLP